MSAVTGLQLMIFGFFCVGAFVTVIQMCMLMNMEGKEKVTGTVVGITTNLSFCLITFFFPLLMHNFIDVTVTETRTHIDSGISYMEKTTKDETTYQAEVAVNRYETVIADVSKDMFSRKPEQAILIQCKLDDTIDGKKVILTDDEAYDTTAIKEKLIESGEKSVQDTAITSASVLLALGIVTYLIFSVGCEHENKRKIQKNRIV